jgi:hypothetical protein
VDPEEFQRYFVQQGRFTAGVPTRYQPSLITGEPTYQAAGIFDRGGGCLVVVRPDQFVARVLPLDSYGELTDFLAQCLREHSPVPAFPQAGGGEDD